MFLLLVSPENDCSTVLAKVKVAFGFFLLFHVDFVVATRFWTLHFSFHLPGLFSLFFSPKSRLGVLG